MYLRRATGAGTLVWNESAGGAVVTDPVREAREELIRFGLRADAPVEGVVPEVIARSWRRSISSSVVSEGLNEQYRDIDVDSILFRAAEPVLDRWGHQLADTGTTLFLCDRAGSIVARRTSDSVRRQLDRVHAAEGFDFSEESVGTNGLGTALAENAPVFIQGSQHYKDVLAGLTCAAVPVATPAGSVIGSVSVGAPTEIANPLMLSLTREIGQQIEERLRTSSRPQDLALAMSFMRFTNSGRPTVVMDRESMLANTPGLPYVSVTSHVLLWEKLTSHNWARDRTARFLLDGTRLEVVGRRVIDGPRTHYVLHFLDLAPDLEAGLSPSAEPMLTTARAGRDGEAGRGRSSRRNGVIVVEGPRGSGRATLARALHVEQASGSTLREVLVSPATPTPWTALAAALAEGIDVLVRRTEDIPTVEASALMDLLAAQSVAPVKGSRAGTLLLTTSSTHAVPAVAGPLGGLDVTARIEPLSASAERIPGLVKHILDSVDPRGRHTLSPAALQSLMQADWPGDLAELVDTLTSLVRQVPASVIQRRHLPERVQHTPPRRHLTLMEEAERAAILKALAAAKGNKSEAATLLGIGRTTLYRRLRQLGLDSDEGSL
jgi:sigma-54 dependent transcriptional regulator, acetoin dehydrogenase operon transcriptional activator AcoR